jgi:hypothetical protein
MEHSNFKEYRILAFVNLLDGSLKLILYFPHYPCTEPPSFHATFRLFQLLSLSWKTHPWITYTQPNRWPSKNNAQKAKLIVLGKQKKLAMIQIHDSDCGAVVTGKVTSPIEHLQDMHTLIFKIYAQHVRWFS